MKTVKIFKWYLCGKAAMKTIKIIVLAIVIVILLAFVLVPGFVSSGRCRQIILDKVNTSVSGKMDFASLSMGWLKGLTVKDFSFDDQAGGVFVRIKRITTMPYYGSILFGNLAFGKTVVEQPQIELNLKAKPAAQGKPAQPTGEKASVPIVLPVSRIDLVVEDGGVKVTDRRAGAGGGTVELANINSKVNLRPAGQKTEFAVNMEVGQMGQGSKVSVQGSLAPPRDGWKLEETSGDLKLEVNDLDIGSLAPLFAIAGVDIESKGRISTNINSKIENGKIDNLEGVISGKNISITGAALKGDRLTTKTLDVKIKLRGEKQFLNIDELQVTSDWLSVRADGAVPVTKKSFDDFLKPGSVYNLKGEFDCDAGMIMSQMPNMFGVAEGTKITAGRLSGNVETFTEAGRKGLRGKAGLTGLAGIVDAKPVTLPGEIKLDAQAASDKGVITFDRLKVSAPFAEVTCSGTMESLKYSAAANLSQLQDQLGQFVSFGKYKMAGEFQSDGQVSVKEEKITAAAKSTIKNLRVSSAQAAEATEPAAEINFAAVYEPSKKTVTLDSLQVTAGFGQLNVKDAAIPLGKLATAPMNLTASATDIDLAKLRPFMVLFASLPGEMQLAGIAQSQVSVSSKKDVYRIVTDSTSIKNLKVTYPGQQPFEQSEVTLGFDVEINPAAQSLAVKKLQLTSPQIKIKGSFEKTTQQGEGKLEGQANLEYDWAAISTIAASYLPKGLHIKGQRADTIKFSSKYPADQPDKMLANLNARAKIGFAQADYMGLVFGPTEVEVWAQNGMLMIPPFSAAVNNGQLNFAAEADFKQKPTFLKIPSQLQIAQDIQITEQMSKELLTYINPIFANTASVSGVANFNCEKLAMPIVGGTKNDIDIVGTISADKIMLGSSDLLGQLLTATGSSSGGEVITIHPTKFTLQNGFLRYDDMQVDIGRNPFNFKGAIGLDKTLDMTITLPYGAGGRVKTGEQADRISVPLRGTTDKPKLDLGRLLEDIAKKQLENELKKSLEGLFKR